MRAQWTSKKCDQGWWKHEGDQKITIAMRRWKTEKKGRSEEQKMKAEMEKAVHVCETCRSALSAGERVMCEKEIRLVDRAKKREWIGCLQPRLAATAGRLKNWRRNGLSSRG